MNNSPTEAQELPDYIPNTLSDKDQAVLDKQNYVLGIKEERVVSKSNTQTNRKIVSTGLYSVIKDMEFYLTNDDTCTTFLSDARLFEHPDAAQGYLNRKRNTPKLQKLLMPTVQDVRITNSTKTFYEEVG